MSHILTRLADSREINTSLHILLSPSVEIRHGDLVDHSVLIEVCCWSLWELVHLVTHCSPSPLELI